nr:MAG TPA: hypothetical protein [Microviridae sp.]
MAKLSTGLDRKAVEEIFGSGNRIQRLSVSTRELSKISIHSLTAIECMNITFRKALQDHVNIARILVTLDETVEIFRAGFDQLHVAVIIKSGSIELFDAGAGFCMDPVMRIITGLELHTSHILSIGNQDGEVLGIDYTQVCIILTNPVKLEIRLMGEQNTFGTLDRRSEVPGSHSIILVNRRGQKTGLKITHSINTILHLIYLQKILLAWVIHLSSSRV